MLNLFLPSSMTGYARNQSESAYPHYWDGLVGYWDFSVHGVIPKLGTALDLSGYNNHATLVGDTHSVVGKFGPVLDFDGSGDYVTIADSPSLRVTTGLTISVWARGSDIISTGLVCKTSLSNDWGDYLLYYSSSNNVIFGLNDYAKALTTSGGPIVANQWHHIAATYDSSNMRIYVDGIEKAVTAYSSPIQQTSDPLVIAGYYNTGYLLTGQIDHVMIWNRSLPAIDITFLYSHPKALITPCDSIIVKAAAAVGGNPWNYYAQSA